MVHRLEELVIEAARQVPERPAVIDRDTAWSYGELDRSSDRLAARFAAIGVIAGSRVGVWTPKSCRAVAALQAILRLGAAYVPIDPATPAARAARILADCDVRLLVTTRAMSVALPSRPPVFLIDDDEEWSTGLSDDRTPSRSVPSTPHTELAYVLYTSGSTGTPKGVCLSHRNALAFVEWAVARVGIETPMVFANHAPFNFDLSVFDLYGAFLTRGTVCLVPEDIGHAAKGLVECIRRHRIGVLYVVPSILMLMMDHGALLEPGGHMPDIVIFAGEPFPIAPLRTLRQGWPAARLFNFYGPTETNVCTAYEVEAIPDTQVKPVPIGQAACGNRVWAVTEAGTVAQEDEMGELLVDGPTVMLGYWGGSPQSGPYRTGDLCVRRANECYEFVGRRDHMVKVRGYRVEPGEIEARLRQHPNVKDIVVLPNGDGVQQRLVAFVVAREAPAPTLLQLKMFGAAALPPYMLVDRVEPVDAMPLTPNGKVDRRSLLQRLA